MDLKTNCYIHKWLGLPRCPFHASSFGNNILQLPLKSLNLGFKQEKVTLLLELRDSSDPVVRWPEWSDPCQCPSLNGEKMKSWSSSWPGYQGAAKSGGSWDGAAWQGRARKWASLQEVVQSLKEGKKGAGDLRSPTDGVWNTEDQNCHYATAGDGDKVPGSYQQDPHLGPYVEDPTG